jgi:hypothetical protein
MQPDSDFGRGSSRVVAARLLTPTNQEGLPPRAGLEGAQPVVFCTDWRGQHADPRRETEVRLLWLRGFPTPLRKKIAPYSGASAARISEKPALLQFQLVFASSMC